MQFTPQNIVDALYASDKELGNVAELWAWFKGQKEYWEDQYDLALATAKVNHNREVGKYGADAAALVAVSEQYIQIPWLPKGVAVTLPDMMRLTSASFDLVSKRYSYLETHIGILQSVNKNILLDYQRAS